MIHNSDPHNDNHSSAPAEPCNLSAGSLNTIQRDRFELLSAYLDGEVTAAERKQVEEWLASDPTVQRLHARLLNLRQALQTMPVPTPSRSAQETANRVFAQVDQRPKLSLIWGGAAIAALFLGAVGSFFFNEGAPLPQFARTSSDSVESPQTPISNEPLLVALDRPLVTLPKTPIAQPGNSIGNPSVPQGEVR